MALTLPSLSSLSSLSADRRALYIALALPLLLRLLRARRPPSRESLLPPAEERVLLLGASSGIGKDLALAYAARGAKVCLVARRAGALQAVRDDCVSQGLAQDRILMVPADVTKAEDLIRVRDAVLESWGGLDTLHVLAGVPSTRTLLQIAGVDLVPEGEGKKARLVPQAIDGAVPTAPTALPTAAGLDAVAVEARACAEINFVGTVLALACFLPLLASTSKSPAVHHLSSVAATIAAPSRCIYSATKSAAFMAMESARVECEGMGVRFFSLLPGTIDNEFRTKTATSQTGGNCEVHKGIKSGWGESLLLQSSKVVDTILTHLALPPAPAPLIPYPPFSWVGALKVPPKPTFFLPWMYKAATLMSYTPLGYLYVEPNARKKYGLRP